MASLTYPFIYQMKMCTFMDSPTMAIRAIIEIIQVSETLAGRMIGEIYVYRHIVFSLTIGDKKLAFDHLKSSQRP